MKKEGLLSPIPSLKHIQRFMKNMVLFAVVFKKICPRNSKSEEKALPNLQEQYFTAKTTNQK